MASVHARAYTFTHSNIFKLINGSNAQLCGLSMWHGQPLDCQCEEEQCCSQFQKYQREDVKQAIDIATTASLKLVDCMLRLIYANRRLIKCKVKMELFRPHLAFVQQCYVYCLHKIQKALIKRSYIHVAYIHVFIIGPKCTYQNVCYDLYKPIYNAVENLEGSGVIVIYIQMRIIIIIFLFQP